MEEQQAQETTPQRPQPGRFPAPLILLLVFGAIVGWIFLRGGSDGTSPGQTPPEISAAQWYNVPAGETTSLAALRGQVVVVEFWATWCPPCLKSIPHLNVLHDRYASRGLVIIGLSNEPAAKVAPFVRRMKMRYRVGAGSPSGKEYGASRIPCAFVVDREGRVAWSGHPMNPEFTAAIEKALAR